MRAGDESAVGRLVSYLSGVPDESVEPIIRACSLELQLANIAEERERVRRRRQYDATGEVQRESLAETAEILRANDIDIAPLAAQLQIEHVLTAHPTEATRRSVLDHQWDVAALLDRLDDPRTGHSRRRALLDELREVLTLWWQTDELRRDPPARRGRGPPQPVLLRGRAVRRGPGRAGRDRARARPCGSCSRCCRYGSWTGGDMDGHPEVGADTLATALAAAPHDRAAAVPRPASTAWRGCSRTRRCGSRCREELLESLEQRRRGAAERRRCCAARTASGSRCGPSSASSTTGSATR